MRHQPDFFLLECLDATHAHIQKQAVQRILARQRLGELPLLGLAFVDLLLEPQIFQLLDAVQMFLNLEHALGVLRPAPHCRSPVDEEVLEAGQEQLQRLAESEEQKDQTTGEHERSRDEVDRDER